MRRLFLLSLFLFIAAPVWAANPQDLDQETRKIAADLRCVVCQNLSVADSPSELAQDMRAVIREQLQEGKSPEQIKAYFVSKYGEWVLLAPPAKGFNLLVWILPFVAVGAGIILVFVEVRRWQRKGRETRHGAPDAALLDRVKREAAEPPARQGAGGDRAGSALSQEQARLYAELRELEFDYQAGRLSETDYQELRRGLEAEAAQILKQIESLPAPRPAREKTGSETEEAEKAKKVKGPGLSLTDWRIVSGGLFLLLFGITLGVVLTRSLRPRSSDQDTMTGGFLTGTNPGAGGENPGAAGQNVASLLSQGREAFERQDFPKAIESFKKALTLDGNQPEAHTYMGLILAQAGHVDGALMAFDRALSTDPKFPLALWGKGMLLYRGKQDYTGARQTLESLLGIMPPGAEREEVQKAIADIADAGSRQKGGPAPAQASAAGEGQQIRGTISIDPRLKSKIDPRAVLFIVVHPTGSTAGPPLAVKRIEHPSFPLSYSLGSENVMMPGMSLSGSVSLSVRLDKDGNPITKQPGDMTGDYKKNPFKVGSQKTVDVVIDRML